MENPTNSHRPGPRGELGAYQFREKTWRMYTSVPFSHANDRHASDEVAVRHYEWLKLQLVRAGMDASPYNIALAWNGGVAAAINATSPRAARLYAQRVENIAEQLKAAASPANSAEQVATVNE